MTKAKRLRRWPAIFAWRPTNDHRQQLKAACQLSLVGTFT
jgi:hypothetical protein